MFRHRNYQSRSFRLDLVDRRSRSIFHSFVVDPRSISFRSFVLVFACPPLSLSLSLGPACTLQTPRSVALSLIRAFLASDERTSLLISFDSCQSIRLILKPIDDNHMLSTYPVKEKLSLCLISKCHSNFS